MRTDNLKKKPLKSACLTDSELLPYTKEEVAAVRGYVSCDSMPLLCRQGSGNKGERRHVSLL